MTKLLSQSDASLYAVSKDFLKRSSKQAWLLAITIYLIQCFSQFRRGDIKYHTEVFRLKIDMTTPVYQYKLLLS